MNSVPTQNKIKSLTPSLFLTAMIVFCALLVTASSPVFAGQMHTTSQSQCQSQPPETKIRYVDAWDKHRMPNPPPPLFLPGSTPVSKLLACDGSIWLFRVIRGQYQKGFTDSKFITPRQTGYSESGYSYSLSPHITRDWGGETMLISKQDLANDGLEFPREFLEDRHPLLPETQVGEILNMYEVKVPVPKENVIAIIDTYTFDRIAQKYGTDEFKMSDLIAEVFAQPQIKLKGRDF